jgi:nucleoside 2-deoxyribosyltransferase
VKEREEMLDIANALEAKGFNTFLPQRDGLELTVCVEYLIEKGIGIAKAGALISQAIFALDVFQVLHSCEALVANLNGRVPDEGTVSEAAMAWSRGKIVIGYKADGRTAFNGQDNPLVTGLFNFKLHNRIENVVTAVSEELASNKDNLPVEIKRENEISSFISLGHDIWSLLKEQQPIESITDILMRYSKSHLEITNVK